jgi:hypothetical protein
LAGVDAMADVFISYSKPYVDLTRDLASDLVAKGITVWWETDLLAGESFRKRIIQELHDCRAAIVIWTPRSVKSDYVISEADRARKAGKLIQVRTADLDPGELPPPFDIGHAALIDDRKAIYGALAKLGVLQGESAIASGPSPLFPSGKSRPVRKVSTKGLFYTGFASVVAIGVLASMIRFWEQLAVDNRASMLTKQFVAALNAGFEKSNLFAPEVRLGRRGRMTDVEAVAELRSSISKYQKINCRTEGDSTTTTTGPEGRSGLRIKIILVCDFVVSAGHVTTEKIPIEIESVPDPNHTNALLITGLWHSDKMVFWQPRARD